MNTGKHLLGASLVAGALAVVAPQLALAAGTAACTQISNTATVNFTVGGVSQPQATSPTASFYVGVKANVSVSTNDGAKVVTYPGSIGTPLSFRVTNNGNAHQSYALSTVAEANNTSDPFGGPTKDGYDQASVSIPDVTGKIASGLILDLAPDAYQDVTVISNTPVAQTDGQVAVYALKAQTQWLGGGTDVKTDGTATAGTIAGPVCSGLPASTSIDVVVADGAGSDDSARDGASSSRDAYQVTAANLSIDKKSAIVWDPINCKGTGQAPDCTDNSTPPNPTTPRLIPGAVVEYTITVSNSASGTATVNISDPLDTNLTFYTDGYASTKGILVNAPSYNGGAPTQLTSAKDGDLADYNGTTAGAVTITGLPVAHNDNAVVKFKAIIK